LRNFFDINFRVLLKNCGIPQEFFRLLGTKKFRGISTKKFSNPHSAFFDQIGTLPFIPLHTKNIKKLKAKILSRKY
jgi:hypothetical protein